MKTSNDWESVLLDYEVTDQQIQQIEDSEPIFENLLFSGLAHVWVAKPNGGKTAIATFAAAKMAEKGLDVFYFQLDASGPQLIDLKAHATKYGYTLLSTLRQGASDAAVRTALERAIVEGSDHGNTVFILDTLKKFVDVNSKRESPKFYALLRTFTQKGGTVLSLAHANKYKDADNNPVPDGVQDLVNDGDCAALLLGVHNPDTLTVETTHDPSKGMKTRAKTVEATFEINKHTYEVKIIDGQAYQEQLTRDERELRDEPVIKTIKELLSRGEPVNQSTLLQNLKVCGVGQRRASSVLKNLDYVDYHWTREKGLHNAWLYTLIPVKTAQTSKPP